MYTKVEDNSSFKKRLSRLTELSQALIYAFDTEMSPQMAIGSTKWEDVFYPSVGQYEDMLTGYLFAQDTLIPLFRNMDREEFTKELLVKCIKQLHGFIGKTLLEVNYAKSGEFTKQQVMRWNPSTQTDLLTYFILSGKTHPILKGQDPAYLLVELLESELGTSPEETQNFIELFKRIRDDNSITMRESQKKYLSDDCIATAAKEKLAVAYLKNLITPKEKALVRKIVSICMDPEDLPEAMMTYASSTIANWKACDKEDIKAVSEFLADMFYQFTEIHPFGNGNGRTATCLMNVFLRSINLPGILLRNPGERDISNSSYSIAIDCINQTREPLAKHIAQRIRLAHTQTFSDEKLAEIVGLRCDLVAQLKQLSSKHPTIDINNYQGSMNQCLRMANMSLPDATDMNDIVILGLNNLKTFLTKEELRLEQEALVQDARIVQIRTARFLEPKLSDSDKIQLKTNLSVLTGMEGWKINTNNNLVCWIEIPDSEKASDVAKLLKEAQIGTIVLTKRNDNHIPVVKCTNINLFVLKNKISLIGEEKDAIENYKM